MRPILAALVIAMAASAPAAVIAPMAFAEPQAAGPGSSFSVQPGRYSWKQHTQVVGFDSKEDNIECLIPEKSTYTLDMFAKDLDKGCRVDNVVQVSGGYDFKLICTGKIPGTAQAQLRHTTTSMTVYAKGSATVAGVIPAGFSMRADANRLGECSAAEAAKELERFKKEGR